MQNQRVRPTPGAIRIPYGQDKGTPEMENPRQQLGKKGEELAVRCLKKRGYRILERNYRNPIGEIDIIAKDHGTLVFIEVKARRSTRAGAPKASVTRQKQRKISMVALAYLKSMRQSDSPARFDVVSINTSFDPPQVELIQNAFELAYP
jgi:putative endonuclease